jgi:Phospholipase_D-nuclease N-terminal
VRILIAAVVVLFLVLWVRAVIDVVRRRDLTGGAKAAWAIIMLLVPFIGLLLYTLIRPSDGEIARRARP